jgi:hypothetical protein
MGEYKGTKRYDEFNDKETLHFSPSWTDDTVINQSLAICPIDNREVSIIASKLYSDQNHQFVHLCLTEPEVEMLIKSLLEAKRRWKD